MSYVNQIIETIEETGGIRSGVINAGPFILKGAIGIYEKDGNKTAVLLECSDFTVLRPLVIHDGLVVLISSKCGKEFKCSGYANAEEDYNSCSKDDHLSQVTEFDLFAM